MIFRLPRAPFIRTSVASLAVAFVLVVVALVRAVRVTPVEASQSPVTAALVRSTSTAPIPSIDIEAVGGNDIFQPDRTAMPRRYPMPGDAPPPDATPVPEPPRPVVLGTVMATDGAHFATCQLPGGRPTLVHVGDRLGEYTVMAIDRDKVVFKTAKGAQLEIASTRPGTSRP